MIEKVAPVSTKHLALLAISLSVITVPSIAQTAPIPTPQEVDQAFREVVGNAGSIEARTRYATLLVRSGNFEGGIAALEGLLLSPDAPASIRVELGVLYYRLGSYTLSETYLRAAIDDPGLAPEQKAQAESLLREVVQRNRPSQISGSVMVGVRGQRNPTAATESDMVYYLGVPVPRAKETGPKSDFDTHLWAKLDHVFDLDQQNEAAVVTSLVAYANHFNSVDSYAKQVGYSKPFDIAILAGSTGIRFKPAPSSSPQLTLRPHLIFGGATANGNSYFTNNGLGVDGDYRVSESMLWGGTYENTRFSFASREDMTNSTLQGGGRQTFRLHTSIETGANRFLMAELGYVDHDGNAPHTGFRATEARVSYVLNYASPIASLTLPWTTTISGGALRRDYRGADPIVDARAARSDTEWRVSLINAMPLTRDVAVQLQFDYTNTLSNISNYNYANTSGTLGVLWKY